MSHLVKASVVVALVGFQSACTVVTSQPTAPGCGAQSAGGSGNPSAGTSSAGTGGSSVITTGGTGGSGATAAGWTNATSNLATLASECGNMSDLSAKPDEDLLIAGIAQKGLWASSDGGGSWTPLGTGNGSDVITNRTGVIVYDPDTTTRFWEAGIYNSFGVYETTDDGKTLVQQGTVSHNDLVSVDFTDPARKTLLAGGHEQAQTMNRSTDGGKTWGSIGGGLPPVSYCTLPLVIDSMTYLVGCGGGAGASGVYRTTDGGGSWSSVTTSGGGSIPLLASDKSIYWASPGNAGMTRSIDDGETWSDVVGAGAITSVAPVELPDGRIATLSPTNVVVSSDHGATWRTACNTLPYDDARGLVYSAQEKAFFVWHFTCGAPPLPVPADAVMSCSFDYETE